MPDKKFAEALKQYGYLGSLANSIPELKGLLQKAVAGTWSSDEFSRNLQDSHWWKSTRDSVKQNQILNVTKPGEWKAKRADLFNKTRLLAAELGVNLGDGNTSGLAQVVNNAMSFGWDEARIRQEIGRHWKSVPGKEPVGTAGQITQKVRSIYAAYGIPLGVSGAMSATKAVLTGAATVETYEAYARQTAVSRYAGFANQLQQGLTMKDIAEPYRQSMSQLLELPIDKLNVLDPSIQKALTSRGADGKPAALPLWQFEQQLRKDPRRDKTKGAVNEAYSAVRQIGQDWGFS